VRAQGGFHLIELVVALALTGLLALSLLTNLVEWTRRWQVRMAATEAMGVLYKARAAAIREGVNVGVKFRTEPSGAVTFQLYRDGDGDGVRNADIDSGTDQPLTDRHHLQHFGPRVAFGLLTDPPPRDPSSPGERLTHPEDPIRFNRSDIAAFSPLGTSTPGSLYLTDHRNHQAAVRVYGLTARIRILLYDRKADAWPAE